MNGHIGHSSPGQTHESPEGMYIASVRRVNHFLAVCGGNERLRRRIAAASCPLDGVRNVDEAVLHPEALRGELSKAPDTEGLRRVVASGQEVDPVFPGLSHDRLAWLTGDEGIESQPAGIVDREGAAAGGDADAGDPPRAALQ